MKIGIVNSSLRLGGAEKVTANISAYFAQQGHKVTIFTVVRDDKEYTILDQVERINTTDVKNGRNSYLDRVCTMRKALKKADLDVILIMGMPVVTYALPAALRLGVPIIASERNDPYSFSGKKITQMIFKAMCRFIDGFVFQTAYAQSYYNKAIQQRSCIIENPISVKYIHQRDSGLRNKTIVNVGRLTKQKNQRMLIEAFRIFHFRYPEYRLKIYGIGELKDALKQQIESYGLDDTVSLMGICENVNSRICNDAMFILSSNYEGMPNALMEAMACGVPSISTDCPAGGPAVIIEDGVNGLLVETGNLNQMVKAMEKLASDESYAESLANSAQQSVLDKFSIQRIGDSWLSFLQIICDNKRSS